MAKNKVPFLERLGITRDREGLAKAAKEFRARVATIGNVLDAAKNRVESERRNIEPDATKADEILDPVMNSVANLSESELLGFAERMESVSEFLSDVLDERITERLGKTAGENIEDAKTAYVEASELKKFAEFIAPMLAQFGEDVSEFTKTGKTGLLLDSDAFPRLRNPENVDSATGTRDYTKRLPVFTVDGETLPWGTSWRTIATQYVQDDAIAARDMMATLKAEGTNYIEQGWTKKFGDVVVTGTRYLSEDEYQELDSE